jgi:oligoribonuclease
MIDKNSVPNKLLWVDLEMTGLDPNKDLIIEVATEVTDFNFRTLASYEAVIKQPKDLVIELFKQNSWWEDYPSNKDDFLSNIDQGKISSEVETDLLSLLDSQFQDQLAILAGNSIHNDRAFIRNYWPNLDSRLHYRMLDVSAWKVLMQGKYKVNFEKKEVHRAFDDIQASIAELQFYLECFKYRDQGSLIDD